ncbi:MAG TPA: type 1 glutamine amidotransferase [Galbitalea sp.]|jgi:GMP synthase (glutamine-hydrolysing)|nr:type 1 glutamine amidotransferase [Galbitalea sp.]
MPRSVLVLQHVPWERPAILGDVLTEHSLTWVSRSFIYGPPPLELSEISGLAVLGGPMNALDTATHPGLAAEAEFVRSVVDAGIPLLAVCLGHQILSTALGAKLHIGAANEVGVGTVDVVSNDRVLGSAGTTAPVLHWHNDVVEAPDGAAILASTVETPNQAFRLGDVIFSMQFHVEVDRHMLDRWLAVDEMADELPAQTRLTLASDFDAVAPRMRGLAHRAFGEFADGILDRD